jgi:hypothetical protein
MAIFWDMTPCSLLQGTCCLNLQDTPKSEAAAHSETFEMSHQTMWCRVSEDSSLQRMCKFIKLQILNTENRTKLLKTDRLTRSTETATTQLKIQTLILEMVSMVAHKHLH